MPINIPRGEPDEVIDRIVESLAKYERDHPRAEIDLYLYRYSPASVRVRIVDSDLAGSSRAQRHRLVWKYLEDLSDDDHGDISTLILLTPDEKPQSFANMNFENPVPFDLSQVPNTP